MNQQSGPEATPLREGPAGMPDPDLRPPVIAETGDPFAELRVIDLVARLERGRPIRVAAIVDALNARWLDWLFTRETVVAALVQLEANWMADYRNAAGFTLGDGSQGPSLTIDPSPRVDPWLVGQAQRAEGRCREALLAFSRTDRVAGGG